MTPKTGTLNLRVSLEFKRKLAEEAAKEKRSVTNYIEATLTTFWDRKDKLANHEGQPIRADKVHR